MCSPLRLLGIFLWCVGLWISSSCEGVSTEWDQQVREWRTRVGHDFSAESLQSRELLRVDFWLNKSMQATQVEDKLFFCGSDRDNQDVIFLGCNNQTIPAIFESHTEFNFISSKLSGYFSVDTIRNRKEEFLPLIQAQTYLRLFINHFFLANLKQEDLNAKAQTTLERLKRAHGEPKIYQAKLVNKIVGMMKEEGDEYKKCLKLIVERLFFSYQDLFLFPKCLAEYMTHDGFFIVHEYFPTNPRSRDIRQIFNTCNNLCERNVHVAVKAVDHPENTAITLSSEHLEDCETVFRIIWKKRAVAAFNLEQMLQFIGSVAGINKKMTVIVQPIPLRAVALASIDDIMKTFHSGKSKPQNSADKLRKKTRVRNGKKKDTAAVSKESNGQAVYSNNKEGVQVSEGEEDQLEGSSPSESSIPDESSSAREEEISALQLQIDEQLVLIGSQNDQLVSLQEANSTLTLSVQERDVAVVELLQQLKTSEETIAGLRVKLKGVIADKKEANRKCFESQTQLKERDHELREAQSAREKDALQIKSLKQDKDKLEMSLKHKKPPIEWVQKSQVNEAKRAVDLEAERDKLKEDNRQAALALEEIQKQKEEAERAAHLVLTQAQGQIDYWKRMAEQSEISYQQSRISNLRLLEDVSVLSQEVKALKLMNNGASPVFQKE